jgi:ketosteroid isomerase-like protein
MVSNAEVVQRLLDAISAGDREALRAVLHPQVVVRRAFVDAASSRSYPGAYEGAEAVAELLSGFKDALDGFEVSARRAEDVGPHLVLLEALIVTGPPESRSHQLTWGLLEVRDELIFSTESFPTEAAARAALGEQA